MSSMLFRERPRGPLRFALRLPVYLYRLDLGWFLGHRFLLLTHRGRRTGLLRQAVIEVIAYDRRTRESIVIAAWAKRADWYRNIQASPALEVETGGRRYVPQHRLLDPDEALAVWGACEREHRLEARLAGLLFGWRYASEAEHRQLVRALRLVAFRPRSHPR